jgi:hypothetical protein
MLRIYLKTPKILSLGCCLGLVVLLAACAPTARGPRAAPSEAEVSIDLGGEWQYEDDQAAQRLALDRYGNGEYAWQKGHFITTSVVDGRWTGQWYQEGNDREGGFELQLDADGRIAEGTWWYTRIKDQNIPPREKGGNFRLRRLVASSPPAAP